MTNKKLYGGISILIGVTIGAGVLALPHAVANAGFFTGIIDLAVIGIAMLVLNLCLGEVTLRTKGNHQLTGYCEKYLGKIGKHLMGASMVIGIYGAIIAYTIGGGQSIAQILGGNSWLWSAIFFLTGMTIIYKGLSALEESEVTMEIIKISVFIVIVAMVFFSGKIDATNLTPFKTANLFLPYGVILFAYLGTTAVPEMKEEMKGSWKQLKTAIIAGSAIPIFVYLIFALAVVGIGGQKTAEIATITIGQMLGTTGLVLANIFAVLAMFTSFIALGYGLKEMYHYDYKVNINKSFLLTCTIPIIMLLTGMQSFAKTLEITGAISGGLAGVLVVLMHRLAKKNGDRKPEYNINITLLGSILLILMFVIGAMFTIRGLI